MLNTLAYPVKPRCLEQTFKIKNSTNSNGNLPNIVGDVHGSQNISGVSQEHYSKSVDIVRGRYSKKYLADLCQKQSIFDQGMWVNEIL